MLALVLPLVPVLVLAGAALGAGRALQSPAPGSSASSSILHIFSSPAQRLTTPTHDYSTTTSMFRTLILANLILPKSARVSVLKFSCDITSLQTALIHYGQPKQDKTVSQLRTASNCQYTKTKESWRGLVR